jgi:hypothetical protein
MKIKRNILTIIPILTFIFFGCDDQAFFDSGEQSTKIFSVDTFLTLEVNDIFEIELQNSDENKIIAEAGVNLLDNLNFYNKNDKLFLEDNNTYAWSRSYNKIKLIIQTTSLQHINIRIPCKITTKSTFSSEKLAVIDWEKFSELDLDVNVDNFKMHVSSDNGGIYKISGYAGFASIRPWGSCFIYADELVTERADVYHRSTGDCFVHAKQHLDIKMEENGILYYKGMPEINIQSHTKGKIISLE